MDEFGLIDLQERGANKARHGKPVLMVPMVKLPDDGIKPDDDERFCVGNGVVERR